ncbi:MAG TPA: helix-turn-helix transcriptional regulator [Acetobacteraceae bacterium]|nr:helix-turn-helix transcriptional regulator [Acetobacteraceae bacterium]
MGHVTGFGDLLRDWRKRRRLSQLDLAMEAEVSQRHLSFVESGRAQPSREMVLHLAERLEVPLRERNFLLVAAGYAPVFPERALDDPAMMAANEAVQRVLTGHEPHPAIAVNRHWNLLSANRAFAPLLAGIDGALLAPPVNVLRLSLHPRGAAPRIANLPEWRAHILARLRRQVEVSADATLMALLEELRGYPVPASTRPVPMADLDSVAVPLRLAMPEGTLSFLSTTMVFGTPMDITLAELTIEAFFPADAATAEATRRLTSAATDPHPGPPP